MTAGAPVTQRAARRSPERASPDVTVVDAPPARHVPRPPPRARRARVLEEVPSLGAELAPGPRVVATRVASAPVIRLEPGPQPIGEWFSGSLHGPGLLLLHGLIAKELHVAGRTATELLGPGDLLRPWDAEEEPVPVDYVWQVLAPTDLAVLDAFFADRIRPWPMIAAELMARAVHRAESSAVQRAIASQPRLDLRVALLLWHLAGRWGKVQSDGTVRLDLPLTHRLIGELIGAERPSVSHAVGRLSKAGVLQRCADGWHLSGSPAEHAQAAMRPLPPH